MAADILFSSGDAWTVNSVAFDFVLASIASNPSLSSAARHEIEYASLVRCLAVTDIASTAVRVEILRSMKQTCQTWMEASDGKERLLAESLVRLVDVELQRPV